MHAKLQSRPLELCLASCEFGWPPGCFASQDEFHQHHGIIVSRSKGWPGKIRPDADAAMNCPPRLRSSLIPEAVKNALIPVSALTRID